MNKLILSLGRGIISLFEKEGKSVPIFHCTNCGFTFKREGKPEQCPDCGKLEIRDALQSEIEGFEKQLQEDNPKQMCRKKNPCRIT